MKSAAGFGWTVAEAVSDAGLYRISLKGHGRSHAMGVQKLSDGQFKFMDPNSGEFHLSDADALDAVLTRSAEKMGYARDASAFEIHRLSH